MALPSCAAVCGRRYSVEHQTTVHPCGAGAAPTVRRTGQSADLRQLSQPKEPDTGFYYGHPQNRFWPLMAALTHSPTPAWEDLDAKRAIIIGSGLAVWDVIHACSIRGASDASIKDVEPNDLAALVNRLGVQAIFATVPPAAGCTANTPSPRPGWKLWCCPPPARPMRRLPCHGCWMPGALRWKDM